MQNSTSASGNPEYDYAPGRPNLFRMMRFKQDVVANCGLKSGISEFRSTFGWPASDNILPRRIMGEREYALTQGVYFSELEPGGLSFVNQHPRVIGEGNQRSIHGVTRSHYIACLANARVRGRSSAVIVDDKLLLDFQKGELDGVDEEFEWDPAILCANNGNAWYIDAPNEDDPLCLPEAFNLLGAHSDFFGHWMCEYLPKYAAAVMSGRLPAVPVLIDADMPPSHGQSLELFFPEQGQIIKVDAFRSVMVERLWVAPDISYYPLYDSGAGRFTWDAISVSADRIGPIMRELRKKAVNGLQSDINHGRRVYLARKPFRHRRLVNDIEIQGLAKRLGFEIVYPEDLTFSEQVTLMISASFIMAAEGSATFLIQFASPKSRAVILSHPFTDVHSDFNEMYRTLGVDLTVFTGPVVQLRTDDKHNADYSIDVEKLEFFLRECFEADRAHGSNEDISQNA